MNEKILQQLYYGKIEPVTKKVVEGSTHFAMQNGYAATVFFGGEREQLSKATKNHRRNRNGTV